MRRDSKPGLSSATTEYNRRECSAEQFPSSSGPKKRKLQSSSARRVSVCAGFPETDWSRTFLSTLLMEPPFPLSPERTTCSREFDVTQQGSAREVEHREPGDCQTEKSKAHSLSLPMRCTPQLKTPVMSARPSSATLELATTD